MHSRCAAYTDLSMAMVIVGSSVVAGKLVISEFPVFLALGLRFVLAVAIIIPFLWFLEGGWPRIGRRDLCLLTFQCFCGGVLFNVFLLYGLKWTKSGLGRRDHQQHARGHRFDILCLSAGASAAVQGAGHRRGHGRSGAVAAGRRRGRTAAPGSLRRGCDPVGVSAGLRRGAGRIALPGA